MDATTEDALRSAVYLLICDGFFAEVASSQPCEAVDALATILVAAGKYNYEAEVLIYTHLSDSGECDHWQAAVGISPTVSEYVNDLI